MRHAPSLTLVAWVRGVLGRAGLRGVVVVAEAPWALRAPAGQPGAVARLPEAVAPRWR